jgi:methyl-accepting chemotaxis protein
MALIKTSKMQSGPARTGKAPAKAKTLESKRHANIHAGSPRPALGNRKEKAAERIAAATEELAAGLIEAASAAAELHRAMEQIAAGAEEATAAAQQQSGAVTLIAGNLEIARTEAIGSERRTASVQAALAEAAGQITTTVRAIEEHTQRQQSAVTVIAELERRAQDISDIALTVSRISDQTNLLALNAAIEAARAGDHGRGFAVVAEEVRSLAEISEQSAQEVQAFTQTIQADVLGIVQAVATAAEHAATEAKTAGAIIEALESMRREMLQLAELAQEILTSATEMARATVETQRGAEQVAGAAQEQSAAAEEAQKAIEEQEKSLDQGQAAARSLAALADGLRSGLSLNANAAQSAAHEIGGAAEQLSATMQEMSAAAGQITVAVTQINRGSQLQASATMETASALAQIEKSTDLAQTNAAISNERVRAMRTALGQNRDAVAALAAAVVSALGQTRSSLEMIAGLEAVSRRIDKVVERISLVAVQTTMLAVSGAVEAARAGEAGRGFAVVSGDIRGLAREATASADQVKDTIRFMLDQVALVRRNLEHIVESAAAEAEKSRLVFVALDRVGADLSGLEEASLTILNGTIAISQAIAQTSSGARQIASAAEQSNLASRQAAIAASEQARSADDLAAAIEEIASLADELNLPNG